jgi:hypothetical protein
MIAGLLKVLFKIVIVLAIALLALTILGDLSAVGYESRQWLLVIIQIGRESDRSFLRRWRLHEFAECLDDTNDCLIVR